MLALLQRGCSSLTQSSGCAESYSQPANWNTALVTSPIPGIKDYYEPLNVIIGACSTVPLNDIRGAMGDWEESSTLNVTLGLVHINCISTEEANVTGQGYVPQAQSWRLDGCDQGNINSYAGLENHARIWNQPVQGSDYGAWFITASYETACISTSGKLYPLADFLAHPTNFPSYLANPKSMPVFHCIDGGPGSYDTEGYDRGARDFAHDVCLAAKNKGWNATEQTITRPPAAGDPDVGEDGVPFSGTVYLLTVTYGDGQQTCLPAS
ncbi:MAG TPA: hypothetical protein VI365_12915 [Trebonia sp.]